ncbi:radical SAM protein [Ruminococcus sp.]|uniref:radical SAM/SPASM domain-containing protein n=1 Tax=Ruminococcus sp. TaxID=41978 RepID=UPI0025EAE8FC|nr:radical SAM protein [Ruminococcus sp.]MBR1433107.1 4Fe-4S cluster-binding domain-containing protein [Ruminococcus sp.]
MEQTRIEKIRKIVLILTQSCNLACVYCYETNKSAARMDFELAKKIIDDEFSKYGEEYLITVEFFGGEPLLCFDLIKDVFDYIQSTYSNCNVRYCMTTNGTLLTQDMKAWFLQYTDLFEFALSLDGTKELHDLNRPYRNGKGSYDDIDIEFFTSNFKESRAKMTVSHRTLCHFSEGVIHLHKLGFLPVVDMASLADYWSESDIGVLEDEIEKLIDYYSQNPNTPICRMLDYDLRRVFIDKRSHFQYCGAGKNMVTYDVDGNWYPCMALSPVSQREKAERFRNEDFRDFVFRDDNKCKECSLLRLCRSCYAANYNQTGDIQQQSKIQCEINRITILASAKIQYNRLMMQKLTKDNLNKEKELTLKAILRIQQIVSEDTFL